MGSFELDKLELLWVRLRGSRPLCALVCASLLDLMLRTFSIGLLLPRVFKARLKKYHHRRDERGKEPEAARARVELKAAHSKSYPCGASRCCTSRRFTS